MYIQHFRETETSLIKTNESEKNAKMSKQKQLSRDGMTSHVMLTLVKISSYKKSICSIHDTTHPQIHTYSNIFFPIKNFTILTVTRLRTSIRGGSSHHRSTCLERSHEETTETTWDDDHKWILRQVQVHGSGFWDLSDSLFFSIILLHNRIPK